LYLCSIMSEPQFRVRGGRLSEREGEGRGVV